MNIGIRAHDVEATDIYDLSQKLADIGANAIQFAPKRSLPKLDWDNSIVTPALARMISDALKKNNIHISVLGCYINPVCKDASELEKNISWFLENIRLASYLGADVIGLETGTPGTVEEAHSEASYQKLLKSFRPMVECAEKLGVIIAVEAVSIFVLHSPETLKRFIDDISSPNLKVIFDPVNIITCENYKNQHKIIDKTFDLLKGEITAIHLKDFKVDGERKISAPIGQGDLDIPYLFEMINKNLPYVDVLVEEYSWREFTKAKDYLKNIM